MIEELKKSPLFNLSLSSKELFHSNFLAWIFEKDKRNVSEFVCKVLSVEVSGEPEVCRELHNFDIVLKFEGDFWVVIENKIKSLPDENQIEKYQNKLKKINPHGGSQLVILSLYQTGDAENVVSLGYNSIVDYLQNIPFGNDIYFKHLLTDYISVLNNLIVLSSQWDKLKLYDFDTRSADYRMLKSVRIHDLFHKIKFYNLRIRLREALEPIEGISFHDFNYFSNSTGAASIRVQIKKVIVELQIQDYALRLMLMFENEEINAEKLDNQGCINELFKYLELGTLDKVLENQLYPKNKNYNRFGKTLIYKSRKIIKDVSIDMLIVEISDFFAKTCEYFVNNNELIENELIKVRSKGSLSIASKVQSVR